jgi:ABC-type phosphate transport system substrate-binding protein
MKTTRARLMQRRFPILLLALAILCPGAHAQVIVIANPSVVAASVSKAELREIFTGASSSLHGGAQITPVLLKQGAAHEEFLLLYIGKSDTGFRAGWRSVLFSGQGVMPKTFDSDAAVVEYVAHTPGAIGYISPASGYVGVRTLAVR